jgi:hypothetical protein
VVDPWPRSAGIVNRVATAQLVAAVAGLADPIVIAHAAFGFLGMPAVAVDQDDATCTPAAGSGSTYTPPAPRIAELRFLRLVAVDDPDALTAAEHVDPVRLAALAVSFLAVPPVTRPFVRFLDALEVDQMEPGNDPALWPA